MGRLNKNWSCTGVRHARQQLHVSSTYTYDLDSDAKPTVNPPDQGREGTRGDVSRGDEENR